jgi:hypothetical protein
MSPAPTYPDAARIIRELGLIPLPEEGGLFAETYRDPDTIPAGVLAGRHGPRAASTAIYYLVNAAGFSNLHRVASAEVFHHYTGAPVQMLQLHPGGSATTHVLGPDIAAGQRPQVVVPRGVWQGTRLVDAALEQAGAFALLGCTVAPGFDYADYEHGRRAELLASYPDHAAEILRLTSA